MGTTLTDCGPTTRDLLARLATPSRNRYYYGKLLDAYHLELEQTYGNQKRWMLNRLSLGAGVLCGIGVLVSADRRRVRITSGVAIDFFGREIIVPQTSPAFDPTQPTDDCGRPIGQPIRGGIVTLFLCYHECEAEPAPALVDECGDGCENGLVRERYRLQVRAGTPRPPGTITEDQCKAIDAAPPPNVSKRTVLCGVLGGECDMPDMSCVPIATISLGDDGEVLTVDACTFRPNVYSNAVLLDLILCLSERVDACCGAPTAVMVIAIVSGNNQAAPAGQPVPNPLVVRVTQSGAPVANEAVTFSVSAGGGEVGDTVGTLGSTFTVNTDASGDATLPIWMLGSTAGTAQQVVAKTSSGAFVTFDAKAGAVPTTNPPVVRAIWPPNGAVLGPNQPNPEATWLRDWRESPRLQITFDRKMRLAHLQAPDTWLRMWAVIKNPGNVSTSAGGPFVATKILLSHVGTAATPFLGVSGIAEEFMAEIPRIVAAQDARFVVQIDAKGANIEEAGAASLLLDAEFDGTKLSRAQLDALFPLGGSSPISAAEFGSIVSTGATLPQSGEGTPGGRFHSLFTVIP